MLFLENIIYILIKTNVAEIHDEAMIEQQNKYTPNISID